MRSITGREHKDHEEVDGNAFWVALQACPGVLFKLEVVQELSDREPVSISVEAHAAVGRITFQNDNLDDIELESLLKLRLEAVHIPNNPGTSDCQFRTGEKYEAEPLILKKTVGSNDESSYTIDLDKFSKL